MSYLSSFLLLLSLFLLGYVRSDPTFSVVTQRQSDKTVTLAGIWPETGTSNPSDHKQAFQLALQDINEDPDWPSDWTLKGTSKDGACHPATGVGALIEMMKENPNIVGVVGPDCSEVALRVSKLAQYYSLPVISPVAADDALSNKASFPFFSRTVFSQLRQAEIWISLMKKFSWRSIATINSDEDDMRNLIDAFEALAKAAGFIVYRQSFQTGQFSEEILQNIQAKGYTVVILATYVSDSFEVLEQAYNYGMASNGSAWFGTSTWQYPNFWEDAPNPDVIKQAAQGSISASYIYGEGDAYQRLKEYVTQNGGTPGLETGYVYDATMAIGKAIAIYLEERQSMENLDAKNLTSLILEQDFVGATGQVAFDDNGDRKYLKFAINNLIDDEWKQVGLWSEGQLNITEPITFPGGSTKVPLDELPGVIRILGLFPITGNGWTIGKWVEPAFQMALQDAKSMLPPGWSLEGYSNDTRCDAGTGMAEIVDAHDTSDVLAVIGPGCSDVAIPCSLLTSSWDIPILSWGSTAPSLSDHSTYSTFFRVVHSDDIMARSWVAFCQHFGWTQVAVLFSTEEYPQNIAEAFVSYAKVAGITTYTESFISGPQLQIRNQLDALQKKSTIFFLSSSQQDAASVLTTASELGLTTKKYAWIGTDAWQVPGFESHADQEETVTQAAVGSIGIGLLPGAGPQYDEFLERLATEYNLNETVANTAYAYDATMVLMHIINDMINNNQNPRNKKLLLERLNAGIAPGEYSGLTGPISLAGGGRTLMSFVIQNYINGEWVVIGSADQQSDDTVIFTFNIPPVFPGNTTDVPSDVPEKKDFNLSWAVRYVFLIITIFLILLLLLILVIFLSKKEEKIIRLSSVSMGVLTMFGILLYFICVFLLYPEPTDETCLAYIWILKIAFCFTFGCLFVKTLKLWRSYTSPENTPTDMQLFIGVAIIVLFGIGYLILWTVIDPYKLDYKTDPTDETVRWLVCRSDNSGWKWAAFGLECGFMIFGAMIAWKVRNVPTQANESHSVAYSIYNMFIVQVVMFSVVYSTDADPDVNFALEAVTVLAIGGGVLLIVFGAKLFQVYFPSNSRSGSSSFGSTFGKSKMTTQSENQ